jgi:hypothetical protein
MSKTTKKILKQQYDRLKKVVEKVLKNRNEPMPKWALQPVRHRSPGNHLSTK